MVLMTAEVCAGMVVAPAVATLVEKVGAHAGVTESVRLDRPSWRAVISVA